MFQIRRLTDCTLNQALLAWNRGFEGYFFDAKMDVDRFTARIGQECISADLSIVAFDGEEPVGLLLSGYKQIGNELIAWNGGTGVASSHRRKGVGKLLVDKACELYLEKGIKTSTLEAISENKQAISLYESRGYKVVDEVIHLTLETPVDFEDSLDYQPVYSSSQASQFLPLYKQDTPWQSQWWCMKDGQMIQLLGNEGETVAYALFKKQYSADGTLNSIVVTHCFIEENLSNTDRVLEALFSNLFPPSATLYQCTIAFFQTSNEVVYKYLKTKGFNKKIGQVWMKKPISMEVSGNIKHS
ncbi:GNAT family N-acetyltransferase [Sutcliffiella horikoshii]|uniref:GNAT family N-acetyltransferase n=1 Tax=Sutcliffiella horikoshii TaxID=79883 RepID=UPI001F28789E|nr:GNAT family N-acetyltransferase [Sutcliffiella horikoshii]MCG1020419.1 GNAT family N-acetyltransferase [Sutcliffiella horikoshii]